MRRYPTPGVVVITGGSPSLHRSRPVAGGVHGQPPVAKPLDQGLLYLFPIIAALASDPHWRRHLEQVGPMTAGLAIQATTGLRSLPISPWAGLGVLAAWAAGALLAGGLLLRFRDA